MTNRYRSIPAEVDAAQWFPGLDVPGVMFTPSGCPYVRTIHGQATDIAAGDYIITEPDGIHHYPCKPDIFEKKYRPIEAANKVEAALADLRKNALTDAEIENLLR